MHTHTIRTRFTFSDRVRFDSRMQRLSGEGTVFAFTVAGDGQIDYILDVAGGDDLLQPGILEHEMELIEPHSSQS